MFYVLVCCIFCHILKLVYSYFVSLSDIYLFKNYLRNICIKRK